jgi:hypothetical protein
MAKVLPTKYTGLPITPPHKKENATMVKRTLRAGVGARCSVLLSKLHLGNYVAQHFPNTTRQDRLEGLVATRREEVVRKGKRVRMTFFTHPDHPGQEFSSSFLKVTAEGDENAIFEDVAPAAFGETGIAEDVPEPIDESVFEATNNAEDIALVLAQGLDVDDDNEPAPENIPQTGAPPVAEDTGLYPDQSWGWDGLDPRRTSNVQDQPASFLLGWNPRNASPFQMFQKLFPWTWFETVCFAETNKAFADQALTPISLGEFIRFFGLILLMATVGAGFSQENFWQPYDEKTNPCPYNLNKYMSRKRFKCIQRELRFTNVEKPGYVDRFWEVRQMIAEWNKNMAVVFSAAWVICLDEVCPSGRTSGPVLVGCFVPGSPILLEMSFIQPVVPFARSCFRLSLWKERIGRRHCAYKSLTSTARRAACCCECLRLTSPLEDTLFLTLVFVF